jgi:hypothetical protein
MGHAKIRANTVRIMPNGMLRFATSYQQLLVGKGCILSLRDDVLTIRLVESHQPKSGPACDGETKVYATHQPNPRSGSRYLNKISLFHHAGYNLHDLAGDYRANLVSDSKIVIDLRARVAVLT